MSREKNRLRLNRTTLRSLTGRDAREVRGAADDVQQVTRAFTDCEFCGHTAIYPMPCHTWETCPSYAPCYSLNHSNCPDCWPTNPNSVLQCC
ncbi:MAG: hypothetical protein R3B81_07775 [bacterium]